MGEQTFTTLELNCPGCGAFFRLKPKRGRLPKGPIPCPKCSTPIPVPKAQPKTSDEASSEEKPKEATPPQAQIMGRGILKKKKKLSAATKPPEPAPTPSLGHPLDLLDQAFDDELNKPNATFLGFPTLDNSGIGGLKKSSSAEPLSTQELESGQAPENSNAPWTNPFNDKSEAQDEFAREPTIVDDQAIIDKLRSVRNTQDIDPVSPDQPLRDTKDLSPLDPSKPLRDTKEFDPVGQVDRQTPISMDKLDKLFDDEQSNQQAKVKPQDVSWKEDPAGPFDLRDILEAEKNLGNDISGEITRNPALDESIYPTGEHKPAKPLPDDSFSAKMDKPKSSQLSKLSLSGSSALSIQETSDRSNSGAFQQARVSTGDIFSESSAVMGDDALNFTSPNDESQIPVPQNAIPSAGASSFGQKPNKLPDPTTAEVVDPVDQLIQQAEAKPTPETPANLVPSPKLDFSFDSESEAISPPEEPEESIVPDTPKEAPKETPADAFTEEPKEDVKEESKPASKMALSSLLKKKVNKDKLSKLKSSLAESSEAASANSTPTLEQPDNKLDLGLDINEISSALGLNEASEEQSASRATDEFDAQSLASISEAVFDKTQDKPQDKSQETIELRDVDELVAQTESTDPALKVPNLPEDTVPARKTVAGQPLALSHVDDQDATMEAPIDTFVTDNNVRGTITGQHLAISEAENEKPASALPEPVAPFKRLDLKSALQRKLQARAQEDDEFESSKSTLFGTPTSDAHEDPEPIAEAQEPPKPEPVEEAPKEEVSDALDISGLKLEAPSEIDAFPETPASAAVLEAPTEQGQKEDAREQSGIPLISGFPTPSSKSTDDLKIIRSKRRKPGDSHSGLFAQSIAKSLSQESSVTLGAAGERRGSGYIRLPTAEILEVLGEGSYRLMVEDIVYEPVDEQGLTALIKQGVLLGAEQIAEADGDWMPIAEHPVFRRLRRKMAIEAHALLAKYKRKQHEAQPEEERPPKIIEERFSTTRPLHAVTAPEDKDPYGPSEATDDEATKQMPLPDLSAKRAEDEEILDLSDALDDDLIDEPETQEPIIPPTPSEATEAFSDDDLVDEQPATPQAVVPPTPEQPAPAVDTVEQVDEPSEPEPVLAATVQPTQTPQPEPSTTTQDDPQEKPSARPAPQPEMPLDSEPTAAKPSGSGVKWLLVLILIAAIAMAVVVAVKPEWLGLKPKTTPTPKTLATKNNAQNNTTPKTNPKTTPKTDPKTTPKASNNAQNNTQNNAQNNANSPDIKKSPLALAMDKDKAGDHAGAVALLKPLYDKNPNDIEQTLLYARTLNKAKKYKLARRISIQALATKKATKDDEARLKDIYKQSIINDPILTQTKAMELKQSDMDGIEYVGEEKKYLFVKVRQGGQAKYIFKPSQVEWDDRWRADVAAWRLCEMLTCHFKVPKTVPAKIEKETFIKMMRAVNTPAQKKGLDRVVKGDELNTVKEDNGSGKKVQYVYGALQTYHEDAVPFPFEYKALWAAMINVTEEEKELKRKITDVLSLFERVGGGKYHEAITREIDKTNTQALITQVSSLLVFDYLINHRTRFARRSKQYGESTLLQNGQLMTLHHGMSWPPNRASSTVRARFRYASRFSRTLVMSLELIDPKFVNDVLFPDASKAEKRQLKVFWKQRKNTLRSVENLKKKYTEDSVLFFP